MEYSLYDYRHPEYEENVGGSTTNTEVYYDLNKIFIYLNDVFDRSVRNPSYNVNKQVMIRNIDMLEKVLHSFEKMWYE